jgi:hypothetical protein
MSVLLTLEPAWAHAIASGARPAVVEQGPSLWSDLMAFVVHVCVLDTGTEQTLLKTGNESSVDRLMKQIATFMGEITDEFKVVVVKAIHELCLRYPGKYRVLLMFLSSR